MRIRERTIQPDAYLATTSPPPAVDFGRLARVARAVVFDLDGTLLDTEPVYRTAFHAALAEFGASLDHASYDGLVGLPSTRRRSMLPTMLGPAFPVTPFLEAYYRHRAAGLSAGVPVKPGAHQALRSLQEMCIPSAVATSASAATAREHLSRTGLLDAFGAVVTRDDVAHGKPAPDTFAQAAALLGLAPGTCLAVEDSPAGLTAAHDAGMMVAFIPDTVACGPEVARYRPIRLPDLYALAPLLAAQRVEPAL